MKSNQKDTTDILRRIWSITRDVGEGDLNKATAEDIAGRYERKLARIEYLIREFIGEDEWDAFTNKAIEEATDRTIEEAVKRWNAEHGDDKDRTA
jgi:hypothetical protein